MPPASISLESSGHDFTSAFETKRACGQTECTAMMSSHEMWFATSSVPPACGAPSTRSVMPIVRSIFAAHHRT